MAGTERTENTTVPVGVISGLAGGALAAFPRSVGPLIGLRNPLHCRVIGLLDLALVPGLLWGRPRGPWLMARAAVNLPMAAFALSQARGTHSVRNARIFLAAMALATIDDVRSLRAIRCWPGDRSVGR
ncbi:hypothetical protein ABIB25_000197 [Nakamurella sp. UYEF19]|uniref:hypothetical protein n=1 Tax=Nakamurella sp. UYEF19 TaxID=1756392 RepID=UPI0033911F03